MKLTKKWIAVAALSGVGPLISLQNLAINEFYPSPKEFVQKQGLKLSPKATAELEKFNHVRVVELGSHYATAMRFLSPVLSVLKFKWQTSADISNGPPQEQSSTKMPTLLFIPGYSNHYAQNELFSYTMKQTGYSWPKENPYISNEMVFLSDLFHELGHVDLLTKRATNGNRTDIDPLTTETYADLYSTQSLHDDFGGKIRYLTLHRRALNPYDAEHYSVGPILEGKTPNDFVNEDMPESYKENVRKVYAPYALCMIKFDKMKSANVSYLKIMAEDNADKKVVDANVADSGQPHKLMGCFKENVTKPIVPIHIDGNISSPEMINQFIEAYKYFFPESYKVWHPN